MIKPAFWILQSTLQSEMSSFMVRGEQLPWSERLAFQSGEPLLQTHACRNGELFADIMGSDVSEITKAPEILGGRVKTLHPSVHGGSIPLSPNLPLHPLHHCTPDTNAGTRNSGPGHRLGSKGVRHPRHLESGLRRLQPLPLQRNRGKTLCQN